MEKDIQFWVNDFKTEVEVVRGNRRVGYIQLDDEGAFFAPEKCAGFSPKELRAIAKETASFSKHK